ncbi:hypothetical protein [Azospirillum brasilense]|uniref:hypothetical protein n=1 Tax=Azospirillum brasilense TaxID=192 RepID=UPI00157B30E3|nr:hypothetical protein [Azospirillum brasilense]UKJ78200.1 hypothetical protein H1Q64_33355 [Azospirillum brasilense]
MSESTAEKINAMPLIQEDEPYKNPCHEISLKTYHSTNLISAPLIFPKWPPYTGAEHKINGRLICRCALNTPCTNPI